jgi:putative transcriptional regulator
MSKKRKISPLNEAILEIVDDLRGGAIKEETAEKITMRILGSLGAARPIVLTPAEIRTLRERANMSQAVFARLLNVTSGYISQLERGSKRPTGPALAMLHVIKRKGIEAIL